MLETYLYLQNIFTYVKVNLNTCDIYMCVRARACPRTTH